MRVRALRAENFMKFSRLSLEDLPPEGLIAIEGPNESGKSTIGEAILFALFGRARSSKACPLVHLIRWGEEYLRVELEFETVGRSGGVSQYLIYREVDRYGTNYVKALALPERRQVAAGNIEVGKFLAEIVRFDFFEFQQAFYFDQEAVDPEGEALGRFIERLSGVYYLRAAADEIKKELAQREREFGHYQGDIARNLRQAERYRDKAGRVGEIRAQRDAAAAEFEAARDEFDQSKRALEALEDLKARLEEVHRLAGEARAAPLERSLESARRALETFRCAWDEAARVEAAAQALEKMRREAAACREVFLSAVREAESWYERFRARKEEVRAELAGLLAEASARDGAELSQKAERLRARIRRRKAAGWVLSAAGVLLSVGTALSWEGGFPPRELQLTGRSALAAAAGAAAFLSLAGGILFLLTARRGSSALARELETALESREEVQRLETELRRLEEVDERLQSGAAGDLDAALEELGSELDLSRTQEKTAPGMGGAGGESPEPHGAGFHWKPADWVGALDRFRTAIEGMLATLAEAKGRIEERRKAAEARLRKATSQRDRTENELREAEAHRAKIEVLEEKNRELEKTASRIQHDIDVCRTACQLLDETRATVEAKVGPAIARLVRALLPEFTGGRYRDFKISDGLKLQVFAPERSDFVDLRELSGGTREAVFLTIRLAFAHAFALTRDSGAQFVFLDEPFKMMDRERMLRGLNALRRLSPVLKQFLVVEPAYTEDERRCFDRIIHTRPETAELEYVMR